MSIICLIRHGETDWNAAGRIQGRTDIPLNLKGVEQAKQCGKHLSANAADMIIASPLTRAKQTAEIIQKEVNLPLVFMDDFIERCFGEAEGMTFDDRRSHFPDGNIPDLESIETLTSRVMDGIKKINNNYPGEKLLLVAHGAVINAILSHLSAGEIGSGKTRLMNACFSNIHFKDEKWLVHNFNQVSHLKAD
ncbi:histidine phosphatase family protein [Cytobacillus purgationiresistens]|nr:histidine phosphatase family protein [Cytobacillus purgationiresistens]